MLTVTVNPTARYSVTRCDLPDLATLLTGAHVSKANSAVFRDKLCDIGNDRGTRGWYGGITSVEAATALLRNGWQEGATQASALTPALTNIIPPAKPIRRRARWTEDGNELSVDRALAGQWDIAYRALSTRDGAPRTLTLGCNFGGAGNVEHEALFWNAAQMIVTTDILENAGYAVELRALKCNRLRTRVDQHVLLDITVKRAGQPMRADTIAAIFGHAGVYRSFGHVLLLSSPFCVDVMLGCPTHVSATLADAVRDGLTDACDYVLEHAYDAQTATRNIVDALTRVNERTRQ